MKENKGSLHIIIFDGSFETTAFIRRFMLGLSKQGHKITVLGFNTRNPYPVEGVAYQSLGSNQSKISLILTSIALAFRGFNFALFLKALGFMVKGNRKALQEQNLFLSLKTIKPDILHVQWPSLLPWVAPYLQNKDFKIVLSQRGFHVMVRPFVKPDNFDYLKGIYPKIDGLHSVSKAISDVGKTIALPETGIDQVVYTGLPVDAFDYKPKSKRRNILQMVSVGRSHWIKDYPTAIKACALLKAENVPFHYTIIGGAGDEELVFLINALGLTNEVSLTSNKEQQDVFKAMQEADVLLSTSIEEGLANVVVEAMALGTPVISTDCGGMPELMTHQIHGWLVPVSNAEALKQAIIDFRNTPDEVIFKIVKAARLQIEKQHHEQTMILGMEKLYETVLKT